MVILFLVNFVFELMFYFEWNINDYLGSFFCFLNYLDLIYDLFLNNVRLIEENLKNFENLYYIIYYIRMMIGSLLICIVNKWEILYELFWIILNGYGWWILWILFD